MSSAQRWSFRNLSLNARVILTIAVVVIGLAGLTVMNTLDGRSLQMDGLQRTLRSEVQSAVAIAQSYQQRAAKGEFSQAEAQKQALVEIGRMRWNDGTGYVFAFDDDYTLRLHPLLLDKLGTNVRDDTDQNGTPIYQAMHAVDMQDGHGVTYYDWLKPSTEKVVGKMSYSSYFKPWGMHFGTGAYFDDIDAQFVRSLEVNLVKAAGVGLLVILVVWMSMRSIRRSIGGEPAVSAALVNRMADGDLMVDGADQLDLPPGSMMHAMQRLHVKLVEVLGQVQQSSQTVSGAAQEIANGNDDLSQRTQEQASSLEETAASMEQMTSTVKQNAENASHASQLAKGAREQAEHGSDVAAQAVVAMGEINGSSRKIADIVGMIDEIAFQTNLLSLNAAVEAARAGEQGRGFAVVASEVRSLSQRCGAAAKEIRALIEESVRRVEAGSALVDQSGTALNGIVESVKKVTDIVAEIAAASQEQSAGIDQVNKAVMQMDEVTQQNAALVEEAASAAREMQDQAVNLQQEVAYFQLDRDVVEPEVAQNTIQSASTVVSLPRVQARRSAEPVPVKAAVGWTEF